MSKATRVARIAALVSAGIVAIGASSPWVTYVGTTAPNEGTPFVIGRVVFAALVVAALLYAKALAPGERDPRSVAIYVGVLSFLLVLSLHPEVFDGLTESGVVDRVSDPPDPDPAQYTLSGLEHGGGWIALFAAVGVVGLAALGWNRRRASGVAVCGAVVCAVVATLLVPAGGLENASLYRRPPASDPAFQHGLYVTLCGGVVVLLCGVVGALAATPSRHPQPESVILAGLAFVTAAVLFPWGVESVSDWRWWGVPAWQTLFLLAFCPYAALVLAEGLSRRLALAASVLGLGVLAALLAELVIVNAGRVALDATLPALLVPGRVFPVGYYLAAVGAGALLYGSGTVLREPDLPVAVEDTTTD